MKSELAILLPGLMADVAQASANKGGDAMRLRGELNRNAILHAIEQHHPIGSTKIADVCGLTRETTNNHLSILKKRGLVRRLEGHYGGWVPCVGAIKRLQKIAENATHG